MLDDDEAALQVLALLVCVALMVFGVGVWVGINLR